MIILITGYRKYRHPERIGKQLYRHRKKITLVIQGGAPGADLQAKERAELLGIQTCTLDALWVFYRKAAGPIRNSAMLKLIRLLRKAGEDVRVWAYHPDLRNSKGTADMVRKARKAKFKVRTFK